MPPQFCICLYELVKCQMSNCTYKCLSVNSIKPVIQINCHEGVEGAQQKMREEAGSAYFTPALLRIAMFI